MRILFLLMISFSPLFSREFDWTQKELISLQEKYKDYITRAPSMNNHQLLEIECDMTMFQITSTHVMGNKGLSYAIPTMDFFGKVNPMNPAAQLSIEEKVKLAKSDLSKLEVFLFLTPKLMTLQGRRSSIKDYAKFLFQVETEMLLWAQKSQASNQTEREDLDRKYRVLIGELSKIDFPQDMSFYRRKIALSIATLEAAQQEITRLQESLIDLSSKQ
ncbi:MAG: hypothetical protein ACRCS8_03930 [Brevinema sp.]